jgi:YesN/AraC family two-component response regulator
MKIKKAVTIVVVEDEKLIAKSIVNNIEKGNDTFKVIGVAYDGEEGYEMVRTLLPNILFTDIKMPVLDGLKLIAKVSENFPFVKIVVISGYDDFEYARTALHNGVSDYLLKPINLEELQSTLRNLQNELVASSGILHSVSDVKNPGEIVAVVEEYIHANYAKQIDLAEIADAFGFSSAYLTKIFREQLQTTPSKYLNEYRMMIAKQLLRDTALSVKSITEQVGFVDQFHFSKRFKQYSGFSPAQFRLQK